MKLLQLNTWGGRMDPQISALLTAQQPDVACLQETISYPHRSGGFMLTVEEMAKTLPAAEAFFSPVMSYPFFNHTAQYGLTILSKLPFVSQETIYTNLSFKANFDNELDDYNIRNLQHATLQVDGNTLHVLNHHGHHVPHNKEGNEETMRQVQIIADYIDKLDGPIILAGDFNLAPHSQSLELINNRLENLSLKYNLQTTRTNLTHKTEVIDYIFVSDGVKVKDFRALDDVVSDHMALILDFDI